MFSVCIVPRGGRSQCCILNDLQFVNAGRGDHMKEAYSRAGLMTAL